MAETGESHAGPRELVLKEGEKVVKMRVKLLDLRTLTGACGLRYFLLTCAHNCAPVDNSFVHM